MNKTSYIWITKGKSMFGHCVYGMTGFRYKHLNQWKYGMQFFIVFFIEIAIELREASDVESIGEGL